MVGMALIGGLITIYAIVIAVGLPTFDKQVKHRNEVITDYLRRTGQI